jgi:hypothetical protein
MDGGAASTFGLTEVDLAAGLDGVEGMDNVRKLNLQLNGFVDNLNEKIRKLLEEQESDFLSAYRHHIYHVQKELQSWKDKVKEEEMGIKKDSQIRQFKNERDWFKDEALRLGNFTDRMKSDMEALKTKMQEIVEDRAWLRKQLKLAKKQSKFLSVELEQARSANGSAGVADAAAAHPEYAMGFALPDSGDDEATPSSSPRDAPFAASPAAVRAVPPTATSFASSTSAWGRPGSSQEQRPGSSSAGAMSARTGTARTATAPSTAAAAAAGRHGGGAEGAVAEGEAAVLLARYRRIVDQLRRKLEVERKQSQALRLQITNRTLQQQSLEELFVRCIDDARRGGGGRRRAGAGHGKQSTKLPNIAPPGRAAQPLITKDDLTAADRGQVVKRLLADDQVLLFLYRAMFADASASASARR